MNILNMLQKYYYTAYVMSIYFCKRQKFGGGGGRSNCTIYGGGGGDAPSLAPGLKPNRLSNRLFCVRRIHYFKSFWEAPIGCVLVLKRENNAIVLASKNDVTVGYFPKFMSKLANSSLLRSVVQLQEPSSTQKI